MKIYRLIFVLLSFTLAYVAGAKEVVYVSEDPITALVKDRQNRVYVQSARTIGLFTGDAPLEMTFQSEEPVQLITAFKPGNYLLAHDQHFTFVENFEITYRDSLPELITCAGIIGNKLLMGSAGSGIHIFDMQNKKLTPLPKFSSAFINDILIIGNRIWVARDNGISILKAKDFSLENHSKLSTIISKLLFADRYVLAIGEFGGMYKIKLDGTYTGQQRRFNNATSKFTQAHGQIYGLTGDGCYRITAGMKMIRIDEGDYDRALAHDNALFLAQGNKLIKKDITQDIFARVQHNYSLFAENDSTLWIGQNGRILCLKNGEPVQSVSLNSNIDEVFISALLVTGGSVIAGTLGDGLFILDKHGNEKMHILQEVEFNKNNIIQIKRADSLIWIAYLNGLLTIDPKTYTLVRDFRELLGANYLFSAVPVAANEFYIGTSGHGIIHYKNGLTKSMLEDFSIYSMAMKGNRIFAGTENNGVFVINSEDGGIMQISTVHKTLNILPLEKGALLATDYENLFVDDRMSIIYPLPDLDLSNMHINSSTEDKGYVYLGYENGILRIDKSKLRLLENIRLDLTTPMLFENKIVNARSEFKYNENVFTFNYQLYNYYRPQNNQYKFRLLGADSVWQSSRQKQVQYFKLPPGSYEFQLAAGTHPDFIPRNIKSYSFIIHKPFWRKPWFIILLALALGLLILYIFKKREKSLLEKEKLQRARMKAEIDQLKTQLDPHFLFNSLNSLAGIIEEDPQSAGRSMEELSDLYRNILTYKDVDILPLEKDLQLARQYFHIHQLRFEDLIQLDIRVDNTEGKSIISMATQVLIENAIKHNTINRKNKLQVSIVPEDNYLVVKNNKTGNTAARKSQGVGLKNLRQRFMLQTKKDIIIIDEPESFTVKLPLIDD